MQRSVKMSTYSYERVSTTKQDERSQEEALNHIKIDKRYIDKATGKNADRPQLNKLKLDVKEGDNIYCRSISRLGRNVDDLRALCKFFKEKGVTVHFVKEGLNTSGDGYKFMITLFGAFAELEREQISENVKEGMAKAKKHGTRSGKPIGRPVRELPKNFIKYYTQWKSGSITATEFAKLINVKSRTTLYTYIKEYEGDIKQVDKDVATFLYLQGTVSLEDISKTTGITKHKLIQILKEEGVYKNEK